MDNVLPPSLRFVTSVFHARDGRNVLLQKGTVHMRGRNWHSAEEHSKDKGKVKFTTKAQRLSSFTLSLTSALDGVGGQRHASAALSWVGPRAGLDG
jgi:hypothetical protein